MKIEDGTILTFHGCIFDDQWAWEAPCIIYSPFKSYTNVGSMCKEAIESAVDDLCLDIVTNDMPKKQWSLDNLSEFSWRGWSTRFNRRKRAIHHSVKVKFEKDGNGLLYQMLYE